MEMNEKINYTKMVLVMSLTDEKKCSDFLDEHFSYETTIANNLLTVLSNESGDEVFSYNASDKDDLLSELQDLCIDLWHSLKSNGLSAEIISEVEYNEVVECDACLNFTLKDEKRNGNNRGVYCKECREQSIECDPLLQA